MRLPNVFLVALAASGSALATTFQTAAAPTTTSPPPITPSGGPSFHLRLNGSDTFVAPLGFTTTDPTQAETFFLGDTDLFTTDGLQLQIPPGDDGDNTVQAVVFEGLDDTLPIRTAFSLVTQGVDPPQKRGVEGGKRQAVGLTVLLWVNVLFNAPGTTARFCVLQDLVYAVFQSPGDNPDFDALCETVLLTVTYRDVADDYSEDLVDSPASSTSCIDCTDSAPSIREAALTSGGSTAAASTSIEQVTPTESSTFATNISTQMTTGLNMTNCPTGQTLVEFTTVRTL